jgi:undecaprenyl diphosphate synthase
VIDAQPPLPWHVAVIPDGSRRWALRHDAPQSVAYERAEQNLISTALECMARGVGWMTFFTFSRDNFQRSGDEVRSMTGDTDSLVYRTAQKRGEQLHAANIRFQIIGERDRLSEIELGEIERFEAMTRDNAGFNLVLAFDYSGQQEIVRAAQGAAAASSAESPWTIERFKQFLYAPEMPPVDLLIRTAERRLSNYMLWQVADAEIAFVDVLWPDFTSSHLDGCFEQYAEAERRSGR